MVCSADIRETAFVYAITAAGVTHAVTQACSMGELLQCGCEATRNKAPPRPPSSSSSGDGVKWEWGGCGDDVEFGYEMSKRFMDAKRRRGKSDIRTLINLHNNEAGRLVRNTLISFSFFRLIISVACFVTATVFNADHMFQRCCLFFGIHPSFLKRERQPLAVFVEYRKLIFLQESDF